MDFWQLVSLGLIVLSKVRLPSGKPPPEPDVVEIYNRHRSALDAESPAAKLPPASFVSTAAPFSEPQVSTEPPEVTIEEGNPIAVACVPCLRGHISTTSAALSEAERMSRGDGIANAEIAERIRLALEEIVVAERKDLTPEAILRAPASEKAIIEEFLPRIRALRQNITSIGDRDRLVEVAAEANEMARDLTLRHLQSKGVDIAAVEGIAEQVKAGEITLDQGKERVKQLVEARRG